MPGPSDLNPLYAQLFTTGDVDGLVELYEDGAVFHAAARPLRGRAEIRAHLAGLIATRPVLQIRTRQALVSGDVALLVSDWRYAAGEHDTTGTSVEVARQQPDGRWRYVVDLPRVEPRPS